MSPADGVNRTQNTPADLRQDSALLPQLKNQAKTAEDYVMIENRLAAQRDKPKPTPQLNSIFDELRGRLPK